MRTTPTIWYFLLAAWPFAFFSTLWVYSALNPPGNLSEPYAFIAQWSWHVMLLASAMLVVGLPLVLRHLRRNGQRASLRFWIAFGSLCVSTGIQAYGEFVLFRPID